MRSALSLALWLAAAPLAACGGSGSQASSDPGSSDQDPDEGGGSLYARLGSVDGIAALVDELVGRVAADPRIQQFFVDSDFGLLKGQLVLYLCDRTGGPCRYQGRAMAAAHGGRRIQPADFAAFLDDARAALDRRGVAAPTRDELLALLRELEAEVVMAGEP